MAFNSVCRWSSRSFARDFNITTDKKNASSWCGKQTSPKGVVRDIPPTIFVPDCSQSHSRNAICFLLLSLLELYASPAVPTLNNSVLPPCSRPHISILLYATVSLHRHYSVGAQWLPRATMVHTPARSWAVVRSTTHSPPTPKWSMTDCETWRDKSTTRCPVVSKE